MTAEELKDHVGVTVEELSLKLREMTLSSNAHAAVEWGSALRDACAGYRELLPIELPFDPD